MGGSMGIYIVPEILWLVLLKMYLGKKGGGGKVVDHPP